MADVSVGPVADFPDGELVRVDAAGKTIVVARDGERVCAASDRCPHLGFSLSKGPGGLKYLDGVVQCPWHNSRFDVATGENLDWVTGFAGQTVPRWSRRVIGLGRKPAPLTTYPARIEDGKVVVTVADGAEPGA
ncbi:MAG TPA: Rieske 2Fe-2S domain-containing protein [Mycobacteriales bacterium]|jgi:nitrite reductase/ring-hydroxylating ferredoxin subunit|nr:Rieske 2Fe-2S domain-containing protein [Mycobacteriales bacterium]